MKSPPIEAGFSRLILVMHGLAMHGLVMHGLMGRDHQRGHRNGESTVVFET